MPIKPDTTFTRFQVPVAERIGLVIPTTAKILPKMNEIIANKVGDIGLTPPTVPPHKFSYHYVDTPLDADFLKNGTLTTNGIYEFSVRDAVMGVFDLQVLKEPEFSWSFSSTSKLGVLAAIKIGETFDVAFDQEFEQVFHISKEHFPPGVPDSSYGEHAVHMTVDSVTNAGFRVVSSYEPRAKRTDSRLPFFFGFRVYGRGDGDQEFPVWRDLLAQSVSPNPPKDVLGDSP